MAGSIGTHPPGSAVAHHEKSRSRLEYQPMSRRSPLALGGSAVLPAVLVLLLAPALCGPAPAATRPAADPLADSPPFSLTPDQLLTAARTAAAEAPAQSTASRATSQTADHADETAGKTADGDTGEPDDVEILVRTEDITFRDDGAQTVRRHEIYRIGTAAGVERWKEASVDYSPWHQQRPTLQARVVTAAGQVHTLDPATISEVSLESDIPDVYQDRRRLRAPLPAVEPGAVVETLVEVVDTSPLFAAGTVHRLALAAPAPLRHARVTLDYPESLPLRYLAALPAGSAAEAPSEAQSGAPSEDRAAEGGEGRDRAPADGGAVGLTPRVSRGAGRVHVTYELHGVEPFGLRVPGLPPDQPRYPYVAFTTGRSWGAIARAYSAVVDRQIAASDLGNVKIAGDDLSSQWEQIAARVAWMQRSVRYTGVSLGDAAIVPRPPAQTLARRYGDCKDKATLLVAALREIGVPAYVALLRAGSAEDVNEELPGLGAFDHAIVYVPGSPALWIDATDPYSMLGELPTPDQGRLALVASPNTESLIHTPVSRAEDNRITETREVTLAELGPGRVVETSEMTGAPARELRGNWDGASEEQIADSLKRYAQRSYGTADARKIEHRAVDDLSGPMTARLEVDDAQWALTDLLQGFVAIPVPTLLHRLPYAAFHQPDDDAPARRSDFIVREPHEIVWNYVIHVPDGFAVRELPEGETRDLGPARYTTTFEQGNGDVRASFSIRLAEHRLSPDQLAALRDGVESLQEEGNLLIWFDQVGSSLLSAGRVGDALDEFRRLAALHPDEAIHRVQLAQASLAGGLVEEARRQARKAVELEPDSYLAEQSLGLMLLHGSAGRQFTAGFDRAGAIAALERAKELAPDRVEISINLALLHEYGDDGRRYQDPKELATAIDIYQGIQDQLVGTPYLNNLALALLFAGRNQEAFDLLEDKASEPAAAGLLAAAEALVDTSRAAIRRVDHTFSGNSDQRTQALITGGQLLGGKRHYPEAAQLLKAASTSSSNPAQLQGYIRLLDHARPWQEIAFDPESPVSLVPQLMTIAAEKQDPSPKDFAGLLADVWQDDLSNELLAQVVDEELSAQGGVDAVSQGEAADTVFDLIFAAGEMVPDELPGIGWAIHLKTDLPLPDKDRGLIVVREHGGFRLAATENVPASLGYYALALARKGSADAARPWLDHAYELTEAPDDWDRPPTAGELFHAVWAPEVGGESDKSDEVPDGDQGQDDRVELGAAILSDGQVADEDVVEIVRRARDAATGATRRKALDFALARALQAAGDDQALLELGRRIEQETDDDYYLRVALLDLKRYDEVRKLADRELAQDPKNLEPALLRAQTFLIEGKLDRAAAAIDKIMADPDPPTAVYNQAAWLAVVRDTVDQQAVEWAQQSVQKTDYSYPDDLHTLATVYATIGRPEEAHKVILQAIEARASKETESVDWYVFGLIAEQYHLPDAAREYYRRVEPPEDDELADLSTWSLAQRRLEALDAR